MLEIFGKQQYINIDELIKICRADYRNEDFKEELGPRINDNGEIILELNVFKFEIFKACIERILNEYQSIDDDEIGIFAEKDAPISFKMAYNTLLKYNILTEINNE